MVTVKLFATLAGGQPPVREMSLPEGITVGALAGLLALPREQVRLAFVNGRHAGDEQPLAEGDVLALFPPVGGG